MNEEILISCPYCGESWVVEPEPHDGVMEYVEDCHVCCQPIVIRSLYSEQGSQVQVRPENE